MFYFKVGTLIVVKLAIKPYYTASIGYKVIIHADEIKKFTKPCCSYIELYLRGWSKMIFAVNLKKGKKYDN